MALRLPERLRPFERFIKFGIVGGSGIFVNLGVLALLIEVFDVHFALAAVVGIEVSIITNYYLNRLWTWHDRNRSHWAIFSYHGVSLVGAVVQWVVFVVLVGLLDVFYIWASIVGVVAGMMLNFFGNHFLTFRTLESKFTNRTILTVALVGVIMAVIAAPTLQRLMDEQDADATDIIGGGTFEDVFDPEPIVFRGSVSGVNDCTIAAAGQAPVGGSGHSLPEDARGRDFTVESSATVQEPGSAPQGAEVCVFIDGVLAGSSGTIPEDAERVTVFANASPNAETYTITID